MQKLGRRDVMRCDAMRCEKLMGYGSLIKRAKRDPVLKGRSVSHATLSGDPRGVVREELIVLAGTDPRLEGLGGRRLGGRGGDEHFSRLLVVALSYRDGRPRSMPFG